ncbi:hypothetical protein LCGC14_0848770 [marine sediment metagenome]|uniref:Uncharacterized protein n=1 Tax=marine sediment metagenome TaxID=412755 RepID=A0A0F9PAX5_9ZZZZ
MFNSFPDNRRYTTHNYPKVLKEIKAPTDDSIRLLEEFREKAKRDFMKSFRFEGDENTVTKGSVSFIKKPLTCDVVIFIQFDLNGTLHQIQRPVKEIDIVSLQKIDALKMLQREMIFALANKFGVDDIVRYLT